MAFVIMIFTINKTAIGKIISVDTTTMSKIDSLSDPSLRKSTFTAFNMGFIKEKGTGNSQIINKQTTTVRGVILH